jgi:CelD/BcsL family acetyltransferase involved in cellulose biosynthesis
MRFSLLRKQTLHLYATCFANDFARFSPSMVQLRMLLHYAFSHGIEVVDFGVGDSPHKEHFGETLQQDLVEFELYKDRISQLESSMFHTAQRAGHNSQGLEKIGKLLRKVIPYEM